MPQQGRPRSTCILSFWLSLALCTHLHFWGFHETHGGKWVVTDHPFLSFPLLHPYPPPIYVIWRPAWGRSKNHLRCELGRHSDALRLITWGYLFFTPFEGSRPALTLFLLAPSYFHFPFSQALSPPEEESVLLTFSKYAFCPESDSVIIILFEGFKFTSWYYHFLFSLNIRWWLCGS